MIFARSIKKGAIERLDEVEIPLPQDIPLSLFTGGVSTSVHFVCRLFSTAGLTTTSRSAECELLVVNAIDRKNKSVRLRRWTNYFREKNLARRASTAGSASFKEKFEPTARCKDYHNRNKDLLLMDVTEYDGSMEMQVETGKMEQRKSIVVGESDDDMSDRENYVAVRDLHKPQDNPCKEYSRLITLIRRNTNNTNRNKSATFIPRDDDGAVHLDPMSADGFRTSAARRPGDNEYNEDDDEVHPFDQGDANPFASGMAKDDDAKPSYGYNAE
ncbi:hypothetical protein, conserved [Angomonas deanei]|uniref:Uncharacterized protein n=1 Tax=Angomonas deanei TaxID=59799 RepID=A0A7G2C2P7_9TRYP|nr:hypothetical protein, conserved [Angomonas deanei]